MQTTPMDQVGTEFHPAEGYTVQLPDTDYLVIVAGALYGSPGSRFNHANVAAKQNRLHEFKHYRKTGSKFWTGKAGVDFLFVIPKDKIHLVHEKGYSYVPVIINGQKFALNVSGGTFNGWTDTVREYAHVGCGSSQKMLHRLADVALSPEECKAQGITVNLRSMDEHETAQFVEHATKQMIQSKLNKDHAIVLGHGYSVGNKLIGPFRVENRSTNWKNRQLSRWLVATPAGFYRATSKNIDWEATAKASGLEVAEPFSVNYVGEVSEPVEA